MKYLLPLILACTLLCGCSAAPLLAQSVPLGGSQRRIEGTAETADIFLPGDLVGKAIPSPDGQQVFYCTGNELRVWDRNVGVHRRIRELSCPQTLTGVLLDGTVLQCTSKAEGIRQTLFYASADGQLLYRFDGEIWVETGSDSFSAVIPVGDLRITVFGEYGTTPQMVLGDAPETESEPYYSAATPDQAALADCRITAQHLGEEYGIRILLWDKALKDPALAGEHLAPVIRRELSVLAQRLSVFPEGMLQETAAHFPEVNVLLVRNRSPELPCAQFWDSADLCIALESGHSGQDLYHALFHAMETHILGNSKALDRWNELNPAGFAYDEDFAVNTQRDSGIYLLGEYRAFCNSFSMSFPREDRAEIFAHAMMPGNRELFQTEVMQSKLTALCTGIREAFHLKNYDQPLIWEQYLE